MGQLRPRLRNSEPRRGQVIVIFAVTLLSLLFFAGLAIDAGSLYVTYGQLRRAVDGAAVAAANDYKAEYKLALNETRMRLAAMEILKLHDLDPAKMNMHIYICSSDPKPADFANMCPPDDPLILKRKLVWVDATLKAPLYFLQLLGFDSVPLQSHTVAEAAPIDLVIVLDTSESMASETPDYVNGIPYNPAGCIAAKNCQPMEKAKQAAKGLIETLFLNYDQVAVIGYDVSVKDLASITMYKDLDQAKLAVDALQVRDDPPFTHVINRWGSVFKGGVDLFGYNPVFPEDRDGDGADDDSDDPMDPTDVAAECRTISDTIHEELWDDTLNLGLDSLGGPCDNPYYLDSYYWGLDRDADGIITIKDENQTTKEQLFYGCTDITTDPPTCPNPIWTYMTPNSTCTGCGIRAGAQVLKRDGRPNAVWVMVLLSDGLVNLSDTPASNPAIPSKFPLGYCTGGIGSYNWGFGCEDKRKDASLSPRYCLDDPAGTCPPGSISALADTSLYSVYDYALDMIDYASLQKSTNPAEETGSDISIYAIGLGSAGSVPSGASGPIGEYLLRYAAAVGDDGERTPDPCDGVATKTSCGQYYYAPSGNQLGEIFNDISTRIYSRLTQ